MGATIAYPHIALDESGAARIEGTRYKVLHLATEHHHYGWTAEELLRQHPDLRPEQVYAALAYFYDHFDELVKRIEASATAADEARNGRSLSREELLKRQSAGTP